MNEATIFLRQADWSDALWFAIGIFLFYWLCKAFLRYFEEKNREKLTETERNKRMMDSMTDHCNEYH